MTRDWLLGAPDADAAPDRAGRGRRTPGAPRRSATRPAGRRRTDRSRRRAASEDDADRRARRRPAPADDDGDDRRHPRRPAARATSRPPSGPRGPWWRRRAVLVPAGAVAVLAAAYGVDLLVSSGDIPRSTVVAGVDIGGLSPAAAAERARGEARAPRSRPTTPWSPTTSSPPSPPPTAGHHPGRRRHRRRRRRPAAEPVDPADHACSATARSTRCITGDDDRARRADRGASPRRSTAPRSTPRSPSTGRRRAWSTPADGRTLDRDGRRRRDHRGARRRRRPRDADRAAGRRRHGARGRGRGPAGARRDGHPGAVGAGDGRAAPTATSAEVPVAAIAASLDLHAPGRRHARRRHRPGRAADGPGRRAEGLRQPARRTPASRCPAARSASSRRSTAPGSTPQHLAEQLMPVLTQPAPRTVTAELGPVPADFTTEEAKALGIKEKISSFTTNFSDAAQRRPTSAWSPRRSTARWCKPGETFSLNDFTGPRGTAQGYVPAGVISGGQLHQGGRRRHQPVRHHDVQRRLLRRPRGRPPQAAQLLHQPLPGRSRGHRLRRARSTWQWKNDSDTGIYVDTAWAPGLHHRHLLRHQALRHRVGQRQSNWR